MNIASTALVNNAGSAAPGSVAGEAQILVLKKALTLQSQNMAQLLAAVPTPPPLATSGSLGTRLNAYA